MRSTDALECLGRLWSGPACAAVLPIDWDRWRTSYRVLLEGARFADRHGFTAVWTPERHFHDFGGLFPNPSVTGAAVAAIIVGTAFTALPRHYEWAELVIGIPAIAVTYFFILSKWAFGPEDRALFGKIPSVEEATLPT